MPKEESRLNEHGPCASSSKNAKDKSNSTTLLAMRDTKDVNDSNGRSSHCSSEKDSGYSDGSDWQQTDVEDQHSNKRVSRGSETGPPSHPDLNQGNPGNQTLMTGGRELPSICIINNMMLKPDSVQKRGQFVRRESVGRPAAHVILCQQPMPQQIIKPSTRKSNVTGKKINGTYLPILNSYPRIAPHPSKKPPDKSSSNDENLSKRVCTEQKSETTSVTRSLTEQQLYKQPKLTVPTSGSSSATRDTLPSAASSSQLSSSFSSFLSTRGFTRNVPNTHHRRFLNTLEILKQSGLLDITLRTKELLRQSNATEQDIVQLRHHTELLCQTASDSNCNLNDVATWERLHRAMAESKSYPNLKLLHNLQILSHQKPPVEPESPQSVHRATVSPPVHHSDAPTSHLLRTLLDPNDNCPESPLPPSPSEQSREAEVGEKTSEKVAFMPPDSSTD